MLGMQDGTGAAIEETSASGDVFYATSYYFPTTWDGTFLHGDAKSWSFVLQLYGWGALAAGRRGAGQPQVFFFSGPSELAFSDADLALGKWTDLVFEVTWSTGHVRFWRRDEGQPAFIKVVDGDAGGTGGGSYSFKQGLYRGGDVSGRTDVLFVGPTARGKTFLAVESAAFGTSLGAP
jgi:hypothetical protein